MSDASLVLQGAVVTLLKSTAAVAAIVGARVYDSVPESPTFPYITVGDDQVLPELA